MNLKNTLKSQKKLVTKIDADQDKRAAIPQSKGDSMPAEEMTPLPTRSLTMCTTYDEGKQPSSIAEMTPKFKNDIESKQSTKEKQRSEVQRA